MTSRSNRINCHQSVLRIGSTWVLHATYICELSLPCLRRPLFSVGRPKRKFSKITEVLKYLTCDFSYIKWLICLCRKLISAMSTSGDTYWWHCDVLWRFTCLNLFFKRIVYIFAKLKIFELRVGLISFSHSARWNLTLSAGTIKYRKWCWTDDWYSISVLVDIFHFIFNWY